MLGFGKKNAVKKQISKMAPTMDSRNSSGLSAGKSADMGVLAMQYESTVREFNNSNSSKVARRSLKALKNIEKDAKNKLR